MPYGNLHDLLENSSSTRRYFLTLPVPLQMELHRYDEAVHSAAQLHCLADGLEKRRRQLSLGGYR
ncbi:MAG TPA: hypothetical protein H9694_03780 [Firmicutes bacterium]|nr:hypothetical protein [Bacillota bacterium]